MKFNSVVANVARGSWCPWCTNKTEKKIHTWLQSIDVEVFKEWSAPWCKGKKKYRFDFMVVLPNRCLIIEVDGRQHFERVKRFCNDVERQRSRDMFKMKQALKMNFDVIRLYQPDVLSDVVDWQEMLLMALYSPKYDYPTVIVQKSKSVVYDSVYLRGVRENRMECVVW
jgi:hypothetical protein